MIKRWLVISLIGIFALFSGSLVEAGTAIETIDWWGLWGRGLEWGEEMRIGSPLYGEGFVTAGSLFTSPLFVRGRKAVVENAHYTWSASGLILTGEREIAPSLRNFSFGGGTIHFFHDANPYRFTMRRKKRPEVQTWTNPRLTTPFTDGAVILSADFTRFDVLWNETTGRGYINYEMTFTGGGWFARLPGPPGLGGAFVTRSPLFIDPALFPAYTLAGDGSMAIIPEPATMILLGLGLGFLGFKGLKRKKA